MGIYSSFQFLGIFIGGISSGLLYQWAGTTGIFYLNACIGILWLGILYSFNPVSYYRTIILPLPEAPLPARLKEHLLNLPDIQSIFLSQNEQLLYMKVKQHSAKEIEQIARNIIQTTTG